MNNLPADVTMRYLHSGSGDGDRMRALLSGEEVQRVESFADPKRRREFVLGRAAARLLLSERLAVAPSEVGLRVAESGVVEVASGGLYLSISHSGDWAVAAASSRRIGVDIERIAPRFPELEQYMLHPDEPSLTDMLPLDKGTGEYFMLDPERGNAQGHAQGAGLFSEETSPRCGFRGGLGHRSGCRWSSLGSLVRREGWLLCGGIGCPASSYAIRALKVEYIDTNVTFRKPVF